ncbi:hypothetical protein diail_7641 [Diaporthe ilicicola]|nr:hypothetical protein diail_7641 [Diaporthe ilicicola]
MANSGPKRIVVGIDFGTTFSGVAWSIKSSDHPGDVQVTKRWPNVTGQLRISDKVPTTLRRFGNDELQWGFLIEPDASSAEILQWFKLKLDDRAQVVDFIPENISAYSERKTNEVITDYLSLLGAHLRLNLTESIGADQIKDYEWKYVLTVPAIWSERATERTKRAFQDAMELRGTRDITVISEPEAAALSVLQRAEARIVNEGECFMILDAGGGTVDLISYIIQQLYPLVIDEVVPGSGDVCGGATVTNRFQTWLLSKIGDEESFDDEVLRAAVESFDARIKTLVSSASFANNQSFFANVPDLADNPQLGIENELIEISAGDMVSFFQPSVEKIKLLVAQQIAASNVPITSIIMVGGYGQILKGLHEMAPEASTRIRVGNYRARKHYGTELTIAYQDRIHAEVFDKRRWDGLNGCYEVEVMDWFINQGDPVTEDRPFFKNFLVTSRVNQGKPRRIYLIIYSDETSQVAPLSKTDTVRELCAVEADLSQIPENQITQVRGFDGLMYYSTSGQIEIVYKSQTIRFTLIYNGQRYSTVTADFF